MRNCLWHFCHSNPNEPRNLYDIHNFSSIQVIKIKLSDFGVGGQKASKDFLKKYFSAGLIFLVIKVSEKLFIVSESLSVVSDSLQPHGLYSPWNLQARILEWVAFPFSGDLPNPGVEPRSSVLQADSRQVKNPPVF